MSSEKTSLPDLPPRDGEARVLCVGLVASDLLVPTDFPIPRDCKLSLDRIVRQGGGPAANAAVALSRLGMRVSFAGAVGGDAAGQAQIEELAREGVEVSGMVVDETHESVVSVILVDRANGSRTIFSSTGARPRFPAVPDLPDPAPHLLLLDTWMGAESVELAKNARAAGAHVLLDAGTLREDWREFVGVSDYAIVSEPFADALSGAGETEAALACLLARGPSHAAVTRGAKGVVAARKGSPEVLRVPAFEVRAVDTTGAGDAFHAGTAWGLLRGLPWEDSLIAGAAVAALKCRVAGGRMGLPKEEEVQKLLRTTPRADLDR